MQPTWEKLWKELGFDLRICRQMGLTAPEVAERSFRIATDYWLLLKNDFRQRRKWADEQEIEFFKEVKPRFTAQMEYHLVLNQGLLFIPEEKMKTISYWQEEAERYQRFCQRNRDFIGYYESGCKGDDHRYFLQRNNRTIPLPQERIYEDMDCRSSHDPVVRSWWANKLYHTYVQERLKQLQDGGVDSRTIE